MHTRIGYSRVSPDDQTAALQADALTSAQCGRVFHDVMSGGRDDRPELLACLDFLQPGDSLVVWKLDRLGRSTKHLLRIIEDLEARGINFVSLTEGMDTSTPGGKLIFTVFGAFAEYEKSLNVERTRAGLAAARARGSIGGRPSVMNAKKLAQADKRIKNGETGNVVAASIGVSRATLYRHLAKERD